MLLNINNIMKKKVYQIASFKTTFSKKFQLLPAPHKRTGLDRHLHSILGFKNLAPHFENHSAAYTCWLVWIMDMSNSLISFHTWSLNWNTIWRMGASRLRQSHGHV